MKTNRSDEKPSRPLPVNTGNREILKDLPAEVTAHFIRTRFPGHGRHVMDAILALEGAATLNEIIAWAWKKHELILTKKCAQNAVLDLRQAGKIKSARIEGQTVYYAV